MNEGVVTRCRSTGYTAEQFMADYATRSGTTVEELATRRHVVECGEPWGCDDDECEGWAMVPLDWTNTRGIDEMGNTVAWPEVNGGDAGAQREST